MNKYNAPALDKGLDIIEYLSTKAIPQSQAEIANGLDKSPNQFYRMLMCLEERGYIIKDATSGKFSLSLKLYQLSHRHSPVDALLKAAKPQMEHLANQTKQSCHLSILQNGKLMVIAQVKSPGPVSLSIEEGSTFPIIKTTSGRILLSFVEKNHRENILHLDPDFCKQPKWSQKQFLAHLEQIKKQGFELQESEITKGVTDLAVPIGNPETGVFSVLAISSLISITENQDSSEKLIVAIQETASKISRSIGISV